MDIDDDDDDEVTVPAKKPAAKKANNNGKSKSIEEIYQKKTQLEHILLRPDTYIGSIETIRQPMWVWDSVRACMVHKEISYVPGRCACSAGRVRMYGVQLILRAPSTAQDSTRFSTRFS